jgi:GNAT superfamily N-acetyltransferase
VKIAPATPDRWKDLEDLMGPNGAYGGCWCTWFLVPYAEYKKIKGAGAKTMFKREVGAARPPGLIAYDDEGRPVGWLRITPRSAAPTWNGRQRASAPLPDAPADDEAVWAASCFFVREGHRKQGVTSALLKAGIAFAKKNGARVLEACPIDATAKTTAASLFVGTASVFARFGFKELARRTERRPLMRLDLKRARKAAS